MGVSEMLCIEGAFLRLPHASAVEARLRILALKRSPDRGRGFKSNAPDRPSATEAVRRRPFRILGLLEIEWVILGVKVVKGPVDIGFWRLGPTRRSGIMRDGEIGRGTASAVGWIFVRGLSGARDRSWGIW